jgi:hypothetical protein
MAGGPAGPPEALAPAAPPPGIPRRLVRDARVRGAVIWTAVHLVLAVLSMVTANAFPIDYPALVSAGVVAIVVAVVVADIRVSRELSLFANLGVSRFQFALWALAPAALLEGAGRLVMGAVMSG